ncbi:hypothetical protein G8O18_14020 [Enterobacter kobei]|uniref:hypothetical protein n=1 Tax=Enterobacter kobei TaxID=208224 RepID=UPI002F31DC34
MTEIIFADDTSTEIKEAVLNFALKWKFRKRNKLVQGVGINDADYIVAIKTSYWHWKCPIYQKWSGMLERVYSISWQKEQASYIGTKVHPDWLSFMSFRSWCLDNGWRSDYHLDKDFISDSKIYGPETCAFIPAVVNTFIVDRKSDRGDYPIGVSRFRNKFQAQCSDPFKKKQEHLGLFDTPEEAHSAWKKRKHEHALSLANMYPALDPRVLHALRTRYI